MNTPFDAVIAAIAAARYHNHRLEAHSDIVSDGILSDLRDQCATFRADLESGRVRTWKNVASPGDRERRVDLFVGEPDANGQPDITKVRIAIENKSVITAHRNTTNRFDDLKKVVADESLFTQFSWAVSRNRPSDAQKTLDLFRTLPTRGSAQTHLVAYDSVLLVPVRIDNVHPPELPRPNTLGIDVDADYQDFLVRTCKAYTARWHM